MFLCKGYFCKAFEGRSDPLYIDVLCFCGQLVSLFVYALLVSMLSLAERVLSLFSSSHTFVYARGLFVRV